MSHKLSNYLKAFSKGLLLALLLFITWGVCVYHEGIFPTPLLSAQTEAPLNAAHWIPKSELGIHQLILKGSPYERGLEAGKQTRELLDKQENELIGQYQSMFPYPVLRKVAEVFAIRWFLGIQKYFESWTTQEMYGVSKSASKNYDSLIDGFTRQIAYHGLHEVGQMMVDQGGEGMGCTVAAIPLAPISRSGGQKKTDWIIGRNFDFEGGRVFDSDKIMKWVFPDQGYAFVSVIWAGMVGAVTGVNEHGLYISLNAAGSKSFRRYGTPSTLVLLKALQFSRTAEEAVEVIRKETMFITDIFVVSDPVTGRLFRVEKSPDFTEVIEAHQSLLVANHLISPRWQKDGINQFRATEQTSHYRQERGETLLAQLELKKISDPRRMELEILKILRDKGQTDGHSLQLGNRRAIDALIATHAVVYNGRDHLLYVSRGPGISGPMLGFDLKASFEMQKPQLVRTLARDPLVDDQKFLNVRAAAKELSRADGLIRHHHCAEAESLVQQAAQKFSASYNYQSTLGDLKKCTGDLAAAHQAWQAALDLSPAYAREVRALKAKLNPEVVK